MYKIPPSNRSSWGPIALGCLVAIGFAGLAGQTHKAPLLALGVPVSDTDADGIPDLQELVLGLSPNISDTDFDGFSDAEELALQTSPTDFRSYPRSTGLSIGLTARGEGEHVWLFMAMYSESVSAIGEKNVRFAALVAGSIVELAFDRLASAAQVGGVHVPSGGYVATLDIPIDPALIHRVGEITFFIVIGEPGNPDYQSSALCDLSSVDGVVMLRRPSRGTSTPGANTTNPQAHLSQGSSVYQPIPLPDQTVPVDWGPGQICIQQAEEVGSAGGALVTYEVVEADCVDGWDSFCEPDCESSVGTTYDSVDPYALLGY